MSIDAWKIGQELSAKDYYNRIKSVPAFAGGGEINGARKLLEVCNEMINTYDDVLQDQNDYQIELETELNDLNSLQNDVNSKLKELFSEIKELEKKEENGTITEDEQKELEDKKKEFHGLSDESDTAISDKSTKIEKTKSEQNDRYQTKVKIAKMYGDKTVEVGEPLSQTEQKHGFWNKLTGKSGSARRKKELGENMLNSGHELLDKVTESTSLDSEFNKKIKNIK